MTHVKWLKYLFGLQNCLLTPLWELVTCRHGTGTMHLLLQRKETAWGVPILVLSFDVQIRGINGLL